MTGTSSSWRISPLPEKRETLLYFLVEKCSFDLYHVDIQPQFPLSHIHRD